jgi:hypothetical protein
MWLLTGACPLRIPAVSLSCCLSNFSRSSALFLHGLPINSLPFATWLLGPGGKVFKPSPVLDHFSYQTPRCGPSSGTADACLASISASSLPGMPWCPGTYMRVTSLRSASANSASWHSATSLEVTLGLLRALNVDWLSEKIRIHLLL